MTDDNLNHRATEAGENKHLDGLLDSLLDKKERHNLIESFLKEDMGLRGYQAKLVAQILLPTLEKLIKGRVTRGFKNTHEALCKHFDRYDEMSSMVGRWLGYKLDPLRAKGEALKGLTATPQGMDDEKWGKLTEQSRVWITQLAKLDQIALSLGDLTADIVLDLDNPKALTPPPTSRWLRPYNGLIPLTGRTSYIDRLEAFCSAESTFAWTLLYGDGGMGKTRLAHEFVKDHLGDQWQAGFLKHDRLTRLVKHPGFEHWRPLADTLVVVDYAADKTDELKELLVHCVRLAGQREEQQEEHPARLRLLLLERHGEQERGWLHQLVTAGHGRDQDDIADALLAPAKVVAPEVASTDQAMLEILALTFRRWGEITGKVPPVLPQFDETGLRHFRSATQMRPLYIQMAGLHACETGDALELVRLTRDQLLKETVTRERKYIRDKCPQGVDLGCLERAVAFLVFAGPQDPRGEDWLRLLADDAQACGFPNQSPGALSGAAEHLLGRGPEGITPLGPDILAEAFSVTILLENEGAARETLEKIMGLAGVEAWSRILRAVIDLFYVQDLGVLEAWVLDIIADRSYEGLDSVEQLLQGSSVAQRRISVCLYERLLAKLPREGEYLPEEARLIGNLANRYSYLGLREEALAAALRAKEIRKCLAERNCDAFEADLAMSLNNLGNCYSSLGRQEEALVEVEQAKEIYERLAERNPDAFEADLAMSLTNLGDSYRILGRRKKALAAALRAKKIRKRLAKHNPDAFEPDLASSLNNLGNCYSSLGRRKKALAEAERAVEIYERLAERNPDAFEPYLASSLNNLGNRYSNLERQEEALAAARHAKEIYKRLAKHNPDAFEPYLAMSRYTRGTALRTAGKDKDAATSFLAGVTTLSRLFLGSPAPFVDLMTALVEDYIEACQAGGIEPDMKVLAPVMKRLETMEAPQDSRA